MSFKKAQKARQKPHRERGQVSDRQSLGILEKKKDYKLRATNYQNQQRILKSLRQKAQARNPDEFYFKMVNRKLEDGVHWVDNPHPEDTMTPEQKQLMQTQDVNYIQWKLQIEKKKVDKLQAKLKLSEPLRMKNKHIFFVDKKEKVTPKDKHPSFTHPRTQLHDDERTELRGELKGRRRRLKELRCVADKMEVLKQVKDSDDQSKELIVEEQKNIAAIYKWKPMRKK